MAQDIGQDFATTGPTVTLLGSNLTDGSTSAVTSAVDYGAISPLGINFELKLDCQASSDDLAFVKVAWSNDNSDFSDVDNADIAIIVDCTASTVAIKAGSFRCRARYAKFYLVNESGGTINSASTAILFWDAFGDIA